MSEAAALPIDRGVLLADIDERARVDAVLEVERRSVFTTAVVVIINLLFLVAALLADAPAHVFELGLAVVAPLAGVRMLAFATARRMTAGSAQRLRWMFLPLFAEVTAWALFAAWAAVTTHPSSAGPHSLAAAGTRPPRPRHLERALE